MGGAGGRVSYKFASLHNIAVSVLHAVSLLGPMHSKIFKVGKNSTSQIFLLQAYKTLINWSLCNTAFDIMILLNGDLKTQYKHQFCHNKHFRGLAVVYITACLLAMENQG